MVNTSVFSDFIPINGAQILVWIATLAAMQKTSLAVEPRFTLIGAGESNSSLGRGISAFLRRRRPWRKPVALVYIAARPVCVGGRARRLKDRSTARNSYLCSFGYKLMWRAPLEMLPYLLLQRVSSTDISISLILLSLRGLPRGECRSGRPRFRPTTPTVLWADGGELRQDGRRRPGPQRRSERRGCGGFL